MEREKKEKRMKRIGFLGICGEKHPIKQGLNKIGRDPTCDIVLNQGTVSKQHAVINILSKSYCMLMDLESTYKTRVFDEILKPYLPHLINNGDTVQFGDEFGIFRIDEELPMTQAIDTPETSIHNNYISRRTKAPKSMVLESPDVSDRDDSIVAPTQHKEKGDSIDHLTKPSRTANQAIGPNKRDKDYWNSIKKKDFFESLSLTINNSKSILNISDKSLANAVSDSNDIHEMESQELYPKEVTNDDLLHVAETQVSGEIPDPLVQNHKIIQSKGQVRKVNTKHGMHLDVYATNKEIGDNIYSAETQLYEAKISPVSGKSKNENENKSEKKNPPVLYRKRLKRKVDVKSDINEMIKSDALPRRFITRIRKLSNRARRCEEKYQLAAIKMLKPNYFTEKEDHTVDKLISENLSPAEKPDSAKKETEDRRNKLQKPVEVTKENTPTEKLKLLGEKRTNDESIVCDSSLEPCAGTPKSVKRTAMGNSEAPSPMRTQSDGNTSSCNVRPPKTQYVLYSCLLPTEIQTNLEKLGAVTVQDISQCTMYLAQNIRRSLKLLCAVGLGRPVVGNSWVQACMDTKTIVDPWMYILKDQEAEKRYHFNLERTLRGTRNFLKGYRISSTPSVMPTAEEMKLIVECSGGEWGARVGGLLWVCVTCAADEPEWQDLRRRGATLVNSEFIFTGVLQQKADLGTHVIRSKRKKGLERVG